MAHFLVVIPMGVVRVIFGACVTVPMGMHLAIVVMVRVGVIDVSGAKVYVQTYAVPANTAG